MRNMLSNCFLVIGMVLLLVGPAGEAFADDVVPASCIGCTVAACKTPPPCGTGCAPSGWGLCNVKCGCNDIDGNGICNCNINP